MADYGSKESKKLTEAGTKAYQRKDREDRSLDYRMRRRELGKTEKNGRLRKTPYTSDIDQVEYIFYKNEIYPVAILELTRYDFDEYDKPAPSWAKYRSSIITRYFTRDSQGRFCQKMAELLQCGAYIVLFRNDLKSYWIFDMLDQRGIWEHKTPEEYSKWLADLKENKIEELKANE